MTHTRQQIREEVVERLDNITLFGGRVEASRVYALQKTPGAIVYTSLETGETDVLGFPGTSHRVLTVTIELYSTAGSGQFDIQIDNMCEQIEVALAYSKTRFLMCTDWDYRGFASEYSKEGERAAGVGTMEYQFQYRDPQ